MVTKDWDPLDNDSAFQKAQKVCDEQNLPYPPELAAYLQAVLKFREGK